MHNVLQYEPISIMNCTRVNSPGILIHLYSFFFFRIWRAQRERTLHQHKGINQIWLHYMNIWVLLINIYIFRGGNDYLLNTENWTNTSVSITHPGWRELWHIRTRSCVYSGTIDIISDFEPSPITLRQKAFT